MNDFEELEKISDAQRGDVKSGSRSKGRTKAWQLHLKRRSKYFEESEAIFLTDGKSTLAKLKFMGEK